jgi:hypothetical protein
MKPLAFFGVIVVVGLVAIGALLRLTDNSASAKPPALSPASAQAQFVRAGNGVCARYYDELMANLEGRSIPKTAMMKAKWLRIEMPLFERLYVGLRALVPPDRDARSYRRLLRMARRAVHDAHAALHAYETGQVRRVALLGREERRVHLNRRSNSLFRKIGLTICGLNAHQVAARYG